MVFLAGCGTAPEKTNAVAADVLFLVLGKMALYDQSPAGEISLRNHHFIAEIMPKEGRKIVSGTLTSASGPTNVLEFQAEGNAFLAHGARAMNPDELHRLHPDGDYIFSYQTQSGSMQSQQVTLIKRSTIDQMPEAAMVTLNQTDEDSLVDTVDPDQDLTIAWQSMSGNTKVASSELDDLIFVLAFDCFGENIAHSGRPYQGGPYLTFRDSQFVIPKASLTPGLQYTVIVEQATADARSYLGVPSIATYATLTFVKFQTAGEQSG
jgi:hypothetical protein